ncbi:molybdenum ABC transporter ATP-binding protein [Geoanaerobacter pelophilus]|nr:molybdenum ABC transporter ATP-binding protein [Geoanaerobacter pelophilus]
MELRMAAVKQLGSFSLSVDFTLVGERTGIFGASGSGKSTLVALIAGLQQPDQGEIVLDGEPLFSSSKSIDLPAERRRVAVVFQHPCLFPHLSVKSNLLYGLRRCLPENRVTDFGLLVEILELKDLLKRGVNLLSGGERQRVALGRALLANPRLLLMDEPLSALDDGLRFQIIPYLKAVSEQFGIPYLFISHSLTEMRLMAEEVLVLSRGEVVERTSSEQVARSRMGQSKIGYINQLNLQDACRSGDLFSYRWGDDRLLISAGSDEKQAMFQLSSKDIILFRKHPEAISARNLLKCTVGDIFTSGNRVGVELLSGANRLVAELVQQALEELQITVGSEVYAAIKASAFRRVRGDGR